MLVVCDVCLFGFVLNVDFALLWVLMLIVSFVCLIACCTCWLLAIVWFCCYCVLTDCLGSLTNCCDFDYFGWVCILVCLAIYVCDCFVLCAAVLITVVWLARY